MGNGTPSLPDVETAAEYAQAEQCFYDYKGPPYRLQDQVHDIEATILKVEADGFIRQPGILAVPLPLKDIDLENNSEFDQVAADSSPSPSISVSGDFLFNSLTPLRHLRLPSEPLDLGYNTTKDVQQYINEISLKSSSNILHEWLPLSSVNINNDEGIDFPPASARWQKLVEREVGRESLILSDSAKRLLDHEGQDLESACTNLTTEDLGICQVRIMYRLKGPIGSSSRQTRFGVDRMSPMSLPPELDEACLLSPRVAFIDLTSEPSSPADPGFSKLQDDMLNDTLNSDVIPPSTAESPPPSVPIEDLLPPQSKISDLRMDVPLMDSGSAHDKQSSPLPMPTEWMQASIEPDHDTPELLGQFDEAMESIMESSRYAMIQAVEGQQLNTEESSHRLQVPSLNFGIREPEWRSQLSDPTTHFRWMCQDSPSIFCLEPVGLLELRQEDLEWNPIPFHRGRVSLSEALEPLTPEARQYLLMGPPELCSESYISRSHHLSILEMIYEEEIEPGTPMSANRISPLGKRPPEETASSNNPQPSKPLDDILESQSSAVLQSLRGNSKNELVRLLPDSKNSDATSNLLSGFIELRRPKKSRLLEHSTQETKPANRIQSKPVAVAGHVDRQQPVTPTPILTEAPVPDVLVPTESCRFIVSVDLSRKLISHIEKAWPQLDLIDKDYLWYNKIAWSPGTTQRKEIISPLSFEADISISPSVGIILTTLLKAKQKPLPSSNAPTPLRHRAQMVSDKYESLVILVSEANPLGEYVGNLSASDTAAYTDFVKFATSLRGEITVKLVHGAEETLGKHILEVMARFAATSSGFAKLLSAHDTVWGLCLRRAGLNVFATQVLEDRLAADYGDSGMDKFMAMTEDERVLRYATLVGGPRLLKTVSKALNNGRA